MFAVVRTGGKQYRVAKDDVIRVEKLEGEEGETIVLDDILAVGDEKSQTIGAPTVADACVAARVLGQTKSDKILVFKKKRRQNYRRTRGHRQQLTVLRITEILTGGKKPVLGQADTKAAKPKAKTAKSEIKAKPAEPKAKTAPESAPKSPAAKSAKTESAPKTTPDKKSPAKKSTASEAKK